MDNSVAGDIEFKDVIFTYPTNPRKKILRGLSLKPLKNKFNAIIGSTGAGKSTIAQLLLKFYSPKEGNIYIGGHEISEVDTVWLRDRIGYVGQ